MLSAESLETPGGEGACAAGAGELSRVECVCVGVRPSCVEAARASMRVGPVSAGEPVADESAWVVTGIRVCSSGAPVTGAIGFGKDLSDCSTAVVVPVFIFSWMNAKISSIAQKEVHS